MKAKQEQLLRDQAEGAEAARAGQGAELEQVDGFDNSVETNLSVKRRYID